MKTKQEKMKHLHNTAVQADRLINSGLVSVELMSQLQLVKEQSVLMAIELDEEV